RRAEEIFQIPQGDARVLEDALAVVGAAWRVGRRDVVDVRAGGAVGQQSPGGTILQHQLVDRRAGGVGAAGGSGAARALRGAGVDLALLQARVAEDAFLTLAEHFVEIDLLVGTGLDAVAVASAALLVDQDDAVLLALVDGLAGTRLHAGGVRAVVA